MAWPCACRPATSCAGPLDPPIAHPIPLVRWRYAGSTLRGWARAMADVTADLKRKSPVRNTFKTDRRSRSAGPQKRTKAPECRPTRRARGCDTAPRTPRPLSHGNELPLALSCPSRCWVDVCTNHGEGGAFAARPAARAVPHVRNGQGRFSQTCCGHEKGRLKKPPLYLVRTMKYLMIW